MDIFWSLEKIKVDEKRRIDCQVVAGQVTILGRAMMPGVSNDAPFH